MTQRKNQRKVPFWTYFTGDRLTSVIASNTKGDQEFEIVLGTESGAVHCLDKNGKPVSKFNVGSAVRAMCSVNIYPTNQNRLILGTEDGRVISLDQNGQICWEIHVKSRVSDLLTLEAHDSKDVEIIVGCWDGTICTMDMFGNIKRRFSIEAIIREISIADIDNDGILELVVGCEDNKVYAVELDGRMLWTYEARHRVLNLIVIDVNRDGYLEVVFGSDDGTLYILSKTGQLIWQYHSPSRISKIATADMDKDGLREIIALGSRYVTILSPFGEFKEQFSISRFFRRIFPINVDDETTYFIVDTRKNETYCFERESIQYSLRKAGKYSDSSSYLKGLTAYDKGLYSKAIGWFFKSKLDRVAQIWKYDGYGEGLDRVFKICVLREHHGPQPTVLAACGDGYVHFISKNGKFLKRVRIGQGKSVRALALSEHDSSEIKILVGSEDGNLYALDSVGNSYLLCREKSWINDLVAYATKAEKTTNIVIGTQDGIVHILNDQFREQLKYSADGAVRCVGSADIDHDGIMETIVGSNGHTVSAINSEGRLMWKHRAGDKVRSICISDIDNDCHEEIIAGSEDKRIHVLDSDGKTKWQFLTEGWIRSICVGDIDNDGSVEIIAGGSARVLYVIDDRGMIKWKEQLPDEIRTLCLYDLDEDGSLELLMGSLTGSIYAYKFIEQQRVQKYIDECLVRMSHQKAPRKKATRKPERARSSISLEELDIREKVERELRSKKYSIRMNAKIPHSDIEFDIIAEKGLLRTTLIVVKVFEKTADLKAVKKLIKDVKMAKRIEGSIAECWLCAKTFSEELLALIKQNQPEMESIGVIIEARRYS